MDDYDIEPQADVVTDKAAAPPQPSANAVWSLSELRQGAYHWNLASDCGLLNYMKAFSKSMGENTKSLIHAVDELNYSAQSTSVRLHNTFNSFIQLSTSQFVENRVYDDDEKAVTSAAIASKTNQTNSAVANGDMSKEEVESLLVPKYTDAIKRGIEALDLYIAQEHVVDGEVQIASDSNIAGVSSDYAPQASQIISSNYWNRRPLPFIINTPQFAEDDFCGLYYEEIESEPSASIGDETEIQDGLSVDSLEDDYEEGDLEDGINVPVKVPRKKKKKEPKQGDAYDMSPEHSEDEFESEQDENMEEVENGLEGSAGDEASEFESEEEAADRKINQELDSDDPRASLRRQLEGMYGGLLAGAQPPTKKKKAGKSKKIKVSSALDDNQGQPDEHTDENGIDQPNGAAYANGDAASESQESAGKSQDKKGPAGIEDESPVPKKKVSFLDDDEDENRDIFASTAPKSRYASISIFDEGDSGSNSLFGDPVPKSASTTSFAPNKASTKKKSAGFFDDEEEPAAVANPAPITVTPAAVVPSQPTKPKTSSIFSDEPEGDIFASTAPAKPASTTAASKSTKPKSTKKTVASVFDDLEDDNDFLSAAAERAAKDDQAKKDKAAAKQAAVAAPVAAAAPIKPKSSVFDDIEDDLPTSAAKSTTGNTSSATSSKKSLFEEPEDSVQDALTPAVEVPKANKPFGGVSVLPQIPVKGDDADGAPVKTKPSEIASANKLKKSMFDEDDSESGPLFPIAKKTTTTAPTATTVAATTAAPKKKSFFDSTGDEEDDLLASLSTKPIPKTTAKTDSKLAAKKSVFDDEGDDLLGPVTSAPSKSVSSNIAKRVSVFEDESVKEEKPPSLKEEKATAAAPEKSLDKPVSSANPGSKIASLAQNLKFNPSAMLPGATRPKTSKSIDELEAEGEDEKWDEDVETGETEETPKISKSSASEPTPHEPQLLSDPNMTRAKAASGRRLPTRRPPPSSTSSDFSTASTSSTKSSISSIFDSPSSDRIHDVPTTSVKSFTSPDTSASSSPTPSVTTTTSVSSITLPSGPAAFAKPVGSTSITETVSPLAAAAASKAAAKQSSSSIFDESPAPVVASTKFKEPAPVEVETPVLKANSIFEDAAPVKSSQENSKPQIESKSAESNSISEEPATKPPSSKPSSASIFDDPTPAPVVAPAPVVTKKAPASAASIFDDIGIAPVKPKEPAKPAATIFDAPSSSPAPAKPATPVQTSTPSVFDAPIATKPAEVAKPPATPEPAKSVSIFNEPSSAAKPSVSSIFDAPSSITGTVSPAKKSAASIFDEPSPSAAPAVSSPSVPKVSANSIFDLDPSTAKPISTTPAKKVSAASIFD